MQVGGEYAVRIASQNKSFWAMAGERIRLKDQDFLDIINSVVGLHHNVDRLTEIVLEQKLLLEDLDAKCDPNLVVKPAIGRVPRKGWRQSVARVAPGGDSGARDPAQGPGFGHHGRKLCDVLCLLVLSLS